MVYGMKGFSMRRTKQILLTLLLTAALSGLSWYAGRGQTRTDTAPVVIMNHPVEAGHCLSESDLDVIMLPENRILSGYVKTCREAVGKWVNVDLSAGELLHEERMDSQPAGIQYPGVAPGRRLMTIRLDPADANGFWLSDGSRVDLYLIPRSSSDSHTSTMIHNVHILKVFRDPQLKNSTSQWSSEDDLLCLDLSPEQAFQLAKAGTQYNIKVSVITSER
jgi:Flp pilus assembly protein CpaB